MKKTLVEKSLKTPIKFKYDVVIIGGGIAGVAAAVAAARNKMRVCIIEKNGMLGGLATTGLIGCYLPICDGMGKKVASGIAEELLKLSVEFEPKKIPEAWRKSKSGIDERKETRYQTSFNPVFFALSLDKWIRKNNVDVLFETLFVDAIYKNGSIKYIICEDISGRFSISSGFVIDVSGSSIVAARCNVPTIVSPNVIASWFYMLQLDNSSVKKNVLSEEIYSLQKIGGHIDKTRWTKKTKMFSGIKPKDITDFYFSSRELVYKKTKRIQKKKKDDRRAFPVTLPSMAQFRNIRRIKGRFMLDKKHAGLDFPDAIGMIGDWRKKGQVYQIPFRTLAPKNINNLLAAGRNVSATDSGIEILRVIPACAVTGQAAGVVASIAVKDKNSIHKINIKNVQKRLKKQGAML